MKRIAIHAGVAVLAAIAAQAVMARDLPPSDARPLSEIVGGLESKGYNPVVEIDFDDGRWEVEAYRDRTRYELRVDPRTGEVLSERRDH
jgi:hypothetical protein